MYSSSSVPNVVGIFIDYLAKLLGNLEISQGCKHSVLLAQHYIPVIGWLINMSARVILLLKNAVLIQ